MRSSSCCESYCTPPLCYLPCLPKSKDDADAGHDPKSVSPSPTVIVEDKPPMIQKIEEAAPAAAAATTSVDGIGDDNDKCYREVAVAPKSCLKRANCKDNSKIAAKGNVKWRDLLGTDLTQVKVFEPRYAPCSCHVSTLTSTSTV